MPVPQSDLYTRVSAWQTDGWQPQSVQPQWSVMDERAVCQVCLAASVPR